MRAVTSDIDAKGVTGNPTESFLRVLDQFASLRTYPGGAPAVGGYRVLPAQRERARTPVLHSPSIAALGRARMRLTGFLSVLFVGGLGLAVLAGPANCPCSSAYTVADQPQLSRLGYVRNAVMMTTREFASRDAELPPLSTAALIEPNENAVGESPINTSALKPSRELPSLRADDLAATTVSRLPVEIEQLADAAPATIKLAAASIVESDVLPMLPVIEAQTAPISGVIANERNREPPTKARSARKRTSTRAYRSPMQQLARAKSKQPGAQQVAQTAPRWAQQMFVNPWQSKAFSYTQ
jgi:hypothetical protein